MCVTTLRSPTAKRFSNCACISRFDGSGLPPGTSLALLMLFPWERTNAPITIDLQLLTRDGQSVSDPGGSPVRIQVQTEVGRPPGIEPGVSIDLPLTFQLGRLRLPSGRYTWQLSVDDQTRQPWQLSFRAINES